MVHGDVPTLPRQDVVPSDGQQVPSHGQHPPAGQVKGEQEVKGEPGGQPPVVQVEDLDSIKVQPIPVQDQDEQRMAPPLPNQDQNAV